jgi:hypothetical protein
MAKPDKAAQLELLERQKRIPLKTQETLRKMISRRHAELCGPSPANYGQTARKAKAYLPGIWLEHERETDPEPQMDRAE